VRPDPQVTSRLRAFSRLRAVPGGIWALGFVSLFMDISSEMVHSLLPVFLVDVLGASAVTLGLIEGIGEAAASITKLFSGTLSDRLGRRKLLTGLGYGLGAAAKPFFALATSASWVLAARFGDRVGKGIRGAPRDALVADLAPPHLRGAAYGLRQALDTVGAFAGPLLAFALLQHAAHDIRFVFRIAVIPALLSVAILIFGVKEPVRQRDPAEPRRLQLAAIRRLGAAYWAIVAVGALLTLARFSEAFLVLRVASLGLPLASVPLVLVVMNVVYALSAYPMGSFSDSIDRRLLLAAGLAVLALAEGVLAAATSVWVALIGVALWGLQMGMTQGLLAALVADAAPARVRGTAFGVFHLVSGLAMLLASLLAGVLWEQIGAPATFVAGALFTGAALVALLLVIARSRSRS